MPVGMYVSDVMHMEVVEWAWMWANRWYACVSRVCVYVQSNHVKAGKPTDMSDIADMPEVMVKVVPVVAADSLQESNKLHPINGEFLKESQLLEEEFQHPNVLCSEKSQDNQRIHQGEQAVQLPPPS